MGESSKVQELCVSTGQVSSHHHPFLGNSTAFTWEEAGEDERSTGAIQLILSHPRSQRGSDDRCS
jgi:hypothetical protein